MHGSGEVREDLTMKAAEVSDMFIGYSVDRVLLKEDGERRDRG